MVRRIQTNDGLMGKQQGTKLGGVGHVVEETVPSGYIVPQDIVDVGTVPLKADWDIGGYGIKNAADPVDAQDLATKAYVLAHEAGVSGISGYSGYSGISGINGTSGYSGFSGVNGTSGYSGYSGTNGTSGYSGYSGVNGSNGMSGYSGYSGTNGSNGTSGYSGFSGITPSGYLDRATGGIVSGDIEFDDMNEGIILRSRDDDTRYRIFVNASGVLDTEVVS